MTNYAIATKGLSKSYQDNVAVKSLSLLVQQGEIFGLLGHNGAGKTTTVNMLTTLLEPTSGHIEIDGVNARDNAHDVRRKIGYLPESVQLYNNMTTMENLRFFAKLSGLKNPDSQIEDTLDYLDFSKHADKKVGSFSKGMRQRVGIAQAIVHRPAVLFLDEPTSGLDPEGVVQLREIIIGLNKRLGMTIFMNTHLLSEVTKTCTSIGILRQGKLAYQSPLDEVLSGPLGVNALEEMYMNVEAV
jgi:ABC-2 type transport system ATP-binding protein